MVPEQERCLLNVWKERVEGRAAGAGGGFCKGARERTPKLAGVQHGAVRGVWRTRPGVQGLPCCPEDLESLWFCSVGESSLGLWMPGMSPSKSPTFELLDTGDAAELSPQVLSSWMLGFQPRTPGCPGCRPVPSPGPETWFCIWRYWLLF